MNFEDNFDCACGQNASSTRFNEEPLSLFDANSRDSGFDEAPMECLGDDAFLEEFAEINLLTTEKSHQLPTDFSNLIQKPLVTVTVSQKPTFRRAFSLEENVSPLKKKICQRPVPSHDFLIRRKKIARKARTEEISTSPAVVPKTFNSEEAIKSAIQRSYSEPDLIADFSRNYSLPLAASRHQDLRAIDGSTLKKLLNGEFQDRVGSYQIIDCRYPYEYNGGHINGAINIYTHDQCSEILEKTASNQMSQKPNILIFHCEFSAERGPNLYRHLRQEDRRLNAHAYPSLCFPEIYILEGGYKKFFEENSGLCAPVAYTQMLDPEHSQDLVFFRQTSKTWNSDVKCSSKKMMRNKNIRRFVL